MNKTSFYIALGSNLDQPLRQIQRAMERLKQLEFCQDWRFSELYETKPMGPIVQDNFINAVGCANTSLSALNLLMALQNIEKQHQRKRDIKWGPRTLDLDILLYGNETYQIPELTIPHPGLLERAFVLYPLAELAPDMMLPNGILLKHYLQKISADGLDRKWAIK